MIDRLVAAGAILVGKTNLDQFATGLVGVRSPYGVARNPFDAAFIPGGSSSGSGVAVAAGLVSFALGTDTAGSGRVPAALHQHRRPEADQGHDLDQGRGAGLPLAGLRLDVRADRGAMPPPCSRSPAASIPPTRSRGGAAARPAAASPA